MMRKRKIIIIGNYPQDKQESMERFAKMLECGLRDIGLVVEIWKPIVVFGKLANTTVTGVGKWLGYLDKWVLYPLVLRWNILTKKQFDQDVRFHICDHSNAPYLKHLPISQTVITCHDVLAIRGALGDTDTYCPASALGKILQKWILSNLVKATRLASVSQQTIIQLNKINRFKNDGPKKWQVIYNGFNADFRPMNKERAFSLIESVGVKPEKSFILHVGSSLPRKNRKLLLNMVSILDTTWDGYICYAGEAADKDLLEHMHYLGLYERVVFVVRPDHATLVALYSCCEAFIFPSFSEGFGWPVIEAQACGAPVIISNVEPMPEVSGGSALQADPHKPEEFAAAFISLQSMDTRFKVIQNGFLNVRRFETSQMIQSYLALYG
ncbi:glycosyltransferase family 4 protein [Pontibacter sp. MBLB2868]|uniref:glycosyltransferase family 4 protein n=1 Tax=Pontibacter sp. MBLB2868 TaxID=3451555 RepID=UPI003F74CD88